MAYTLKPGTNAKLREIFSDPIVSANLNPSDLTAITSYAMTLVDDQMADRLLIKSEHRDKNARLFAQQAGYAPPTVATAPWSRDDILKYISINYDQDVKQPEERLPP